MIEAYGDYDGAVKLIAGYGYITTEIGEVIQEMNNIPRDLNLSFSVNL